MSELVLATLAVGLSVLGYAGRMILLVRRSVPVDGRPGDARNDPAAGAVPDRRSHRAVSAGTRDTMKRVA